MDRRWWLGLVVVAGCATTRAPGREPIAPHERKRTAPSAPPAAARPPHAQPSPGRQPALDAERMVELELEWGEPAVVAPPVGAHRPQPVLVATHGAGGRAEIHCAMWRRILGEGRGFVLCPRGYPMNRRDRATGYFYDGHPALGREMREALDALAGAFEPFADLDRPVFAGYSQGASMGALVLPEHEAGFSRAVLWEGGVGGHREWNLATAERFARQGGERVLMACGRDKCHEPARTSAGYLRRAGVEVRIVHVPGAGHTYGGPLAEAVGASFDWLVEGDPRW